MFEAALPLQYVDATRKYHRLQYDQFKQTEEGLEWRKLKKELRKDTPLSIQAAEKEIKEQYYNFDQGYYGYVGLNGHRYLRIDFYPHQINYYSIPGTGESHIYTISPLVFNLDTKTLSFDGWTGENDWKIVR